MPIKKVLLISALIFLLVPKITWAIVPPDFVVQVGSNLGIIISSIIAIIVTAISILVGFFRKEFDRLRQINTSTIIAGVALIAIVLLVISFVVFQNREKTYQQQVQTLTTELILKSPGQYGQLITIEEENPGAPTALMITNEKFKEVISRRDDVFLLDVREDPEVEVGYFPGSQQIRFADLLDGAWRLLPTDTPIYILCWSGLRGKIISDFLLSKGITAHYLENGISGWVASGGAWEGSIYLEKKYFQKEHAELLETNDVVQAIKDDVAIIDTREPDRFLKWHFPGSTRMSVIGTPSEELSRLYSKVPTDIPFITVCDDFVNCFDARIVGIELEKTGRTYIGRYIKPWEYRSLYDKESF